eukprot:TRINITY_DN46823_c0_g1_i1.p1 TRINITY_DN46823_c0_g1~~TRINITY_DN46823_c0_g1_i1.p1  ORF type:complete len:603 (+),score=153.75 TRINITY_DN46823_c0_g1_i1:99-1811(+)
MSSRVARALAALKPATERVFKPSRLSGDCPEAWLNSRNTVNQEGNEFIEINLHSTDAVTILTHARQFYLRAEVYGQANDVAQKLASDLVEKEEIASVPQEWQFVLKDFRSHSRRKAEWEYSHLAHWKVRFDEMQPDPLVKPEDYLWLQHAIRMKFGVPDSIAAQYFPLPAVIDGIRQLAAALLKVKDAPTDELWYKQLCPWQRYNETVACYPECLTPPQVWEMFRCAGFELASQSTPESVQKDTLVSAPHVFASLFERFAQDPVFTAQYSNHWSRIELDPGKPRSPLPPHYANLVDRTARLFPAFRLQQYWWYSNPEFLKDQFSTLDGGNEQAHGIGFYGVPDPRRTVDAGLPSLLAGVGSLVADSMWARVDGQDFKEGTSSMYDATIDASKHGEDVFTKYICPEIQTELLNFQDFSEVEPPYPNEFYNETYRPILATELAHAERTGLHLPQWYTRRRKELISRPDLAEYVKDLQPQDHAAYLDLDLSKEDETKEQEAEEGEEEEIDAIDNEHLPLSERVRAGRLQMAIDRQDESGIQAVLRDASTASHYEDEERMKRRQAAQVDYRRGA